MLYVLMVDFMTFGVILEAYVWLSAALYNQNESVSEGITIREKTNPTFLPSKARSHGHRCKKKRFEMGGVIAKPYNVVQELSI